MLHQTALFGLLGGLLVVAFCANRLSRRTRVPDLIILMSIGLVLGPLSGWVDASQFQIFTRYLGTFALILILFEAGVELNLREALWRLPVGVLLAFLGYGLSFTVVSLIGLWFLRLPLRLALLLGGVFGCTSSTMVMPVAQQLNIHGSARVVLLLEAALGDVIAVLTVGSLADITEGDPLIAGLLGGFLVRILVSVVLAVVGALVWSRFGGAVWQQRFGSVLNVGIVLTVYSLARIAGGSGLLAVLAFGLTLANLPGGAPARGHDQGILIFHSDLSFLVRSFFFVLLGASVQLVGRAYVASSVLILAALALSRFLSLYGIRWALRDVSRAEREVMLYVFPRGLITAVLAVQVVEGKGAALGFLPAMAFTIILVTNLLVVVGGLRFRPHAQKSPPEHAG